MISIDIYVFILWATLPMTLNFAFIAYKRKRTNKILNKKLDEKGYKIDVRFKNMLAKKIVEYYCKNNNLDYYSTDYNCELLLASWFPVFRLYDLYTNFEYLFGSYTGFFNKEYAAIEDLIKDEEVINYLKKIELIKEDKEKMKFLKERDYALKELEKKYDEMQLETENKDIIIIHEYDKVEELLEKQAILQEMIERKQSGEKNDNQTLKLKIDGNNSD